MKKIAEKYINGVLALALLMYYLIMSWILHRTGYEHSENLFIAEKIKVLLESDEGNLLTLGTTFPSLVFLSSLVFTPFGYLFAPILASIAITTALFYMIISDFKSSSKIQAFVYVPVVTLLFFLHPGLIYAAISGRGVAAILLFFYLVFRSLFRYYQTQTTYYLSMASIYLSCLIFCDYNFLWLLLAFFPFVVLVSLEGLKINKDQPAILQYFQSVNNVSQRRKLANRTVAIYIIIFLLPFGAILLFQVLNQTHAGNSTYFLTSQYANWHVIGNVPIGEVISNGNAKNVTRQSQLLFQAYVLLLNPLLILAFFYYKGKLYELLTLLAPFILISILVINLQYNFTIEYYLIFLILGLLGLTIYGGRKFGKKVTWFLVFSVALLNVFTGIYYFKNTDDAEERTFYLSIKDYKNWLGTKTINEEFEIAAYVSSIATKQNKILIDDAAAFKVIAHLKDLNGVVLPLNKNFITLVENPIAGIRFILIAKNNNVLKTFSVLNAYNFKQMLIQEKFSPEIMFETEHWAVYRIFKYNKEMQVDALNDERLKQTK
jgi:hypothetical protein